MSRPGSSARFLTVDNNADAWSSVPDAASSGRAFMVHVADDVLALDADRPDQGPAFEALAAELRELGTRPLVVASGQAGRRHLFARLGGHLRARYASEARRRGVDVRLWIRPPLAPHRLGRPVALLDPSDPGAALDALRSRRVPPRLSLRIEGLLRHGDVHCSYPSRSEMLMAIALGAANAGWMLSELVDALLDPENQAGEKVREKPLPEALAYLRRTWEKARARVVHQRPITSPAEARELIAAVRAAMNEHPTLWRGRGGTIALATLLALLEIAERLGRISFATNIRAVAEQAGVCRSAVARAKQRLQGAGWLRFEGTDSRRGRASIWTLRLPALPKPQRDKTSHAPPEGRSACPAADAPAGDLLVPLGTRSVDLWRSEGLGQATRRVYLTLAADGRSVQALAAALAISAPVVRRRLNRLQRFGLAEADRDGRWRRGPADEVALAEQLGLAQVGNEQRRRHVQDRKLHAKGRTAWFERRAAGFTLETSGR